ncbi:hypothetical protein E3J68_01335 [Candidatus Aerophobetes bacterium]|uniref:Uncharacterized protein n=1 Tax=Aerophobetes bacterium TaxID=2030807 RepID=A0A523THM8_UNCAE|nr:MAG: hypothetical protein E3J68_01335 [Candidatus Aerophobetes bacterium]
MERNMLLEEVKHYFVESDHWRRLCAALQDPDPKGSHIHAYVETSVHPDSLEAIMTGYFERMGWPSARKIDHMAPKAGMGSLHGVESKGKPHFDFQWFFHKDVGLRPCEGGESGCNLVVWNRWYINQFYRQFPFREVGAEEEKTLEEYFKSDHFLKGLEFPVMPTTNHMHINVHSSVHPDYIQKYAEVAFQREGLKIYYTCPNVYLVGGKYRGKLVFMGQEPEVVFDIGWKFTPDVVIEPAWESWIFEANPGYDVWTSEMLAEVMDEDYVRLTDQEIQEILNTCKFPK